MFHNWKIVQRDSNIVSCTWSLWPYPSSVEHYPLWIFTLTHICSTLSSITPTLSSVILTVSHIVRTLLRMTPTLSLVTLTWFGWTQLEGGGLSCTLDPAVVARDTYYLAWFWSSILWLYYTYTYFWHLWAVGTTLSCVVTATLWDWGIYGTCSDQLCVDRPIPTAILYLHCQKLSVKSLSDSCTMHNLQLCSVLNYR